MVPQRERSCEIVSHIAENDPAAAIRLDEMLIHKAESLTDVPRWSRKTRKTVTQLLPVGSSLII